MVTDPASPTEYEVEVVIVGAGVVGCAVARALAPNHDVLVVEKGQVAGEASALAAGEVTMTASYTDYPVVAAHATDFFRDYSGTGAFEFHERDSYELVTPDREAVARRRVERLQDEGHDVAFIPSDVLSGRVARLRTDEVAGAVRHGGTGFVDPYTFAVTLKEDAQDLGATFLTETAVEEVLTEGGCVTGVETEVGTVTAPTVVAAAGWRTERFLRGILQVPVRPYRTQCLVLDPGEPLDDQFPMGWIPGEHVYFRPELNGDLLVGGWSFATDDPEGASGQADEAFRQHVADLLPRFFERFDRAGFVDGWAGVDGATPDTRPIVDAPETGPEGLVVATGFHGRGVMTAPVAATLVRSHVTGEATDLPTEVFALDRFESTSPDFPFYSISSGEVEEEPDDQP